MYVTLFFFLMIRRPPRSTLFPYTTPSDLGISKFEVRRSKLSQALRLPRPRSEEHTSELQSHSDIVCRLLLEKKKTIAGLLARITMPMASNVNITRFSQQCGGYALA